MKIRGLRSCRLLAAVCLMLTVFLKASGISAARPSRAAPDFAAVDRYIETQMKEARIPGVALAVIQGERIVYLRGYGITGPSGQPVTPQTPFMIASTIKAFTALAVMQLVEAGQVELDAPVQRYLPWFRAGNESDSAPITVRHLMNHTSGLSAAAGNEVPPSTDMSAAALENRVRRLNAAQLDRPVGVGFEYSSANYDTLGLIVQTVSGQSYETYLQEHVFVPLDMRLTFTSLADADQHGLATGYRSWFGFPVPFDAPRPRAYLPSGWAVSSTVEDLAHFAIAQLNGGQYGDMSLVSSTSIAAMVQPAVQSYSATQYYGMGWNVAPIAGVQTDWVGGDAPNFQARLLLAPQQQLGIVVLMNLDSVNVNAGRLDLHEGVLNLLLNQPLPEVTTPHYLPVFIPLVAILIVTLIFAVAMVRSIRMLRRWHTTPEQQPHGWRSVIWHAGPHLALHLAWASLLLIGFPLVANQSLPFLMLYIPDLGYTLVVSAMLILGWGLVRMALIVLALRNAERMAGP